MLLTGGYKGGSEADVKNMEHNLRTTNNISSNCWVVLRGNFKGENMAFGLIEFYVESKETGEILFYTGGRRNYGYLRARLKARRINKLAGREIVITGCRYY